MVVVVKCRWGPELVYGGGAGAGGDCGGGAGGGIGSGGCGIGSGSHPHSCCRWATLQWERSGQNMEL